MSNTPAFEVNAGTLMHRALSTVARRANAIATTRIPIIRIMLMDHSNVGGTS